MGLIIYNYDFGSGERIEWGRIKFKDGDDEAILEGDQEFIDFFSCIGMGDRGYTPDQGREYIDAVCSEFVRSSTTIVELDEDEPATKGT
ncbi:MAG: hypothetical protein ABSD38_27775 [Syntrophorhabdales bacterium]|jgi:hypothetical protein